MAIASIDCLFKIEDMAIGGSTEQCIAVAALPVADATRAGNLADVGNSCSNYPTATHPPVTMQPHLTVPHPATMYALHIDPNQGDLGSTWSACARRMERFRGERGRDGWHHRRQYCAACTATDWNGAARGLQVPT